jgi:hypothetical protein
MQLNYSPPVHIYRWVVAGIILIDKDVLAGFLSIGDCHINKFGIPLILSAQQSKDSRQALRLLRAQGARGLNL